MKAWAVNFSLDRLDKPPAKSSIQLVFGFVFLRGRPEGCC